MSDALRPHLRRGASAIVHVSSVRAVRSDGNQEGYAAAKAGLLGLTHAQAASLAHVARVNAVLPGWVDTGYFGEISAADHAFHTTGRTGVPDDIAQACLFLCDGARSGFMTGQQLRVDGGISARLIYHGET